MWSFWSESRLVAETVSTKTRHSGALVDVLSIGVRETILKWEMCTIGEGQEHIVLDRYRPGRYRSGYVSKCVKSAVD